MNAQFLNRILLSTKKKPKQNSLALLDTAKFDLLSSHCTAQLFWTVPTNNCELDWISVFQSTY